MDGDGGFGIASKGRSGRLLLHAIYHVGEDGAIKDYIALPNELLVDFLPYLTSTGGDGRRVFRAVSWSRISLLHLEF